MNSLHYQKNKLFFDQLDLEELSSFTSDEDYTNDDKISFEEENEEDIGELSSIEITVSSCDEEENDIEDDLENIEDDLDIDTE